ncbi:MAG: hypothetical protein HY046_11660 [Acidobacteria bacterium]|nr:hypothetical protein [Acidobacteriota bacterium]
MIWHILGCGPLYAIILLSKMGVGDPDPNPIFPGILLGVSFLPSLALMAFGVFLMKSKSSS